MPSLTQILAATYSGALLAARALLTPVPAPTDLAARLATLPRRGLPLRAALTIYWSDQQVPFIDAESDDDLGVGLGIVQAHLRLGQMELLRRISGGRLAELAGPVALPIDQALRTLGIGAAAGAILAATPAATRLWMEAFIAGVNAYQDGMSALPHEHRLLAIRPEPWTATDLLAIGRLASADVNWFIWFRLLKRRQRPDWPALWARLIAEGGA